MNKEKVIKGLEHCLSESEHIDDNPCKGCPYFVSDQYGCERTQMEKDALELLKEDCHNCKLECLLQKYDQLKEKHDKLLKEQEAKQGKWERKYSRPGVFSNLFWWCSVCGQPTICNDAGIFYQYCPHCGAKLEQFKET